MMKKILALLMVSVLALGVCAFAASAEEGVSEPAEEPAVETTEYKIEDILAAIEADEDVYLLPGDTIVLPVPEETTESEEAAAVTEAVEPAIGNILIVEYFAGKDATSGNGMTKFVDYDKSGYAIANLRDKTDYAFNGTERKTNYQIDFVSDFEYEFLHWKVDSIYFGKEFSRISVSAEWAVPKLKGWAGFKEMMRNYIKTFIDYVLEYFIDAFARINDIFALPKK